MRGAGNGPGTGSQKWRRGAPFSWQASFPRPAGQMLQGFLGEALCKHPGGGQKGRQEYYPREGRHKLQTGGVKPSNRTHMLEKGRKMLCEQAMGTASPKERDANVEETC